ncbi:hypothetical protein OF83DRAFT_1152038 [Amylostereum chailletii]|nr:hypothetical protein OF83DRAFT_1152038 [Amylostereum chailletii]
MVSTGEGNLIPSLANRFFTTMPVAFEDSMIARLFIPLLTRSLNNPGRIFCSVAFANALWAIHNFDGWEGGLREKHPEFLDALATFITTPRTDDEFDDLASTFDFCDVEAQKTSAPVISGFHKQLHDELNKSEVSSFDGLYKALHDAYSTILADIPISYSTPPPKPSAWPLTDNAVFPRGTRDTITAFVQYHRRTGSTTIFTDISGVIGRRFPSIFEGIVAVPELMDEAASILIRRAADETALSKQRRPDEAKSRELKTEIMHITLFIRDLVACAGGARIDQLTEYIQPQAIPLNAAMLELKDLYRGMKDVYQFRIMTCLAGLMVIILNALPAAFADGNPFSEPFEQLFGVIDGVDARASLCAYSGCPHKTTIKDHNMDPSKLFRCSGCQQQYYCSAACQKQAWKMHISPHKLICGDLGKLSKLRHASKGNKSVFEMRARSAGFTAERARVLTLAVALLETYVLDQILEEQIAEQNSSRRVDG